MENPWGPGGAAKPVWDREFELEIRVNARSRGLAELAAAKRAEQMAIPEQAPRRDVDEETRKRPGAFVTRLALLDAIGGGERGAFGEIPGQGVGVGERR